MKHVQQLAEILVQLGRSTFHPLEEVCLVATVDVIPNEQNWYGKRHQHQVDKESGIAILLPREYVHDFGDVAMPAQCCSKSSDVVLQSKQ